MVVRPNCMPDAAALGDLGRSKIELSENSGVFARINYLEGICSTRTKVEQFNLFTTKNIDSVELFFHECYTT